MTNGFKNCDNRCGINKENIDHIFTPYYSNKLGNLNLGLTAAKYIWDDNNVSINVTSTEVKGTVFANVFMISKATGLSAKKKS